VAHYQAVLEYDGTDFLGFQRQREGRTVQGEVENALRRLGWTGRAVLGAGRTDTGVHAAGQVIAFAFDWRHGEADLLRALNANLPLDAAVTALAECPPDFHPRYSAKARRYRYTIYNRPVRAPLWARYAWQVGSPRLDVAAMQAAGRLILGRHDFATFGDDPDEGTNTLRTVTRAEWSAEPDTGRLYFDTQAEAFLYRMVRSLVGAFKRVGDGSLTVEAFSAIMESRDRAQCPTVAPPQGLCLMEILY
jgi:tRNA pseudouridine38-40 synthase